MGKGEGETDDCSHEAGQTTDVSLGLSQECRGSTGEMGQGQAGEMRRPAKPSV